MLLRTACAALAVLGVAAKPVQYGERQAPSAEQRMQQIVQQYNSNMRATLGSECTEKNLRIRREWGALSPDDRRRYIAAVKCLAKSPAKTPTQFAPGVRNRHDDFDVSHIVNWKSVHNSALLLHWHRHMVWQMEEALIECGWTEGHPYWDYPKYADLPIDQNPIFDGSDTSLSGDGSPKRDDAGNIISDDDCNCVTSGPFADWVVNIGPLNSLCQNNPQHDGLGYNPRCITRKFNPNILSHLTYEVVVDTITEHTDITDFGIHIESAPDGIHPNPHEMIGGMQNDIPGSSSDQPFYLHHAGLDRLYSLWVGQDVQRRTGQIPRSEAYEAYRDGRGWDMIPQPTLDTVLVYSPAFPNVTIRDVMSTTSGKYCYMYQ